jgi:hypothetical protein
MLVAIKETPQLAARLSAARTRVAAIKLKMRDIPETVVVDETTGRPYNEHTYRHLFAEVRALAIQGSNEHALAPCPSLAFVNERTGAPDFKHDQDLRDTRVMLLDRAGNDLLSICDVTDHSYQSAQLIMKHYRATPPAPMPRSTGWWRSFRGRAWREKIARLKRGACRDMADPSPQIDPRDVFDGPCSASKIRTVDHPKKEQHHTAQKCI